MTIVTSEGAAGLPLRARIAAGTARAVAATARRAGRHGSVIGGRVATVLDRRMLARLAAGRTVVLVTGTNGKTTTTSMIARVLGGAGHGVATNHLGANMPDGITTALLDARSSRLGAHLRRRLRWPSWRWTSPTWARWPPRPTRP